jgi:hypothetical protein
VPQSPVVITAIVVFALISIVLTVQLIISRAGFMIWMVFFTVFEMAGYITFLIFINMQTFEPYLGELIILVLCPNFVGLCIYTVGSRIVAHAGFEKSTNCFERGLSGEKHCFFKPLSLIVPEFISFCAFRYPYLVWDGFVVSGASRFSEIF